MKTALAVSLAISLLLPLNAALAQESTPAAASPTPDQLRRVLEFLKSPKQEQRAGAYKACRAKGDTFKETYKKLLQSARSYHENTYRTFARGILAKGTSHSDALKAWADWDAVATPAREFVLIDHKKDPTKHKEMDQKFAEAEKAWKKVDNSLKALQRSTSGGGERLESLQSALKEIQSELEWCQPEDVDDDETDAAVAELPEEKELNEWAKTSKAMQAVVDGLAKTNEFNDGLKWPSPIQKTFARILNGRRVVLGLQPMRLEEKLSDACREHSKEMVSMGYFAHESPVEKNKTFDMRARNAGFQGSPHGECLAAGDTAPEGAERGWWYSDGHRIINYCPSTDTFGIGISGQTWTLIVANFPWK